MIGRTQTASNSLQQKLSAFIHFCKLRKQHPDPCLLLNGSSIPVVNEAKFLGVIFHNKLSFLPHIWQLKNKCTKALNLLRVLAHTTWGADQETLLHLYSTLLYCRLLHLELTTRQRRQRVYTTDFST